MLNDIVACKSDAAEYKMTSLSARSEPKKTWTPTWTTLLLDYAIKVMHSGEWVWMATCCYF